MSNESKINGFVKRVLKDYPPPKQCVDVGARDGYLARIMKKRGYSIIGIDVEPKNKNVIKADILNNSLEKGIYDIVISRHCIEHCANVPKFLESCGSLLKDSGVFINLFPLVQTMTYDYTRESLNPKEDFLSHACKFFDVVYFGISTNLGIDPLSRDEHLYIGTIKDVKN